MAASLKELMARLPQTGRVEWIGARPDTRTPMQVVTEVEARQGAGLTGDRFKAMRKTREVSLIQQEHIDAVAGFMGLDVIDPSVLRRNIVVSGINLLALKNKEFYVGEVRMAWTDLAQPCSKMEAALGEGGYNAMRGHGGVLARLLSTGIIRVGDKVRVGENASID